MQNITKIHKQLMISSQNKLMKYIVTAKVSVH